MYSRFFNKLATPFFPKALIGLTALVLASPGLGPLKNKLSLWNKPIQCLDTVRANKPQIIKLISQAKQQLLILIYNRESENQLKQQILKYEWLAEKLGIKKLVLVDQTDLRHLQTFTRILREDVDEDVKKQNRPSLPVNLEGKIKIMYVNPTYDTNKPFLIESADTLREQVRQIRSFLKLNPSEQELRRSLQTFNCTTVIKNCYNQTCVEEYSEKIRQLIDVELLREKGDNFSFYVTTGKNEAAKLAGVVNQTSNKQEIYVFRNDMLGKSRELYSEFIEKEGANYEIGNKFMMMIRPRVHVLGKRSLNTDLYWYISTLRSNPVPTFSINNTMNNLPIRVIQSSAQASGVKKDKDVVWLKGHPKQVQLIRKIKEKYGKNIEIAILETNMPSELIRHVYQPQRYCIFSISPTVPYPKLLIKPPTLNVHYNSWWKVEKVNEQNPESFKANTASNDWENYEEKWDRVMDKISQFMAKPANYSILKIYSEKQMEINADQLKQMLENKRDQKWILRVCGFRNSCLYSAYEKYGISVNTPVYKLDSQVQNVDIKEADYQIEGQSIHIIQ